MIRLAREATLGFFFFFFFFSISLVQVDMTSRWGWEWEVNEAQGVMPFSQGVLMLLLRSRTLSA